MIGGRAQALLAMTPWTQRLLYGVGLILVISVLGFGLSALRRWHHRTRDQDAEDPGFSIEQIENLRETGRISDEEFASLRRVALGLDEPSRPADNSVTSGNQPADEDTMQGEA